MRVDIYREGLSIGRRFKEFWDFEIRDTHGIWFDKYDTPEPLIALCRLCYNLSTLDLRNNAIYTCTLRD